MKKHFLGRILWCLFIITFLFAGSVKAQEPDDVASTYDFSNWRLLLQVNGPTNWNAAINAVKPMSEKWTLRFGVSPIVSFSRSKGELPENSPFVQYEEIGKSKKIGGEFSIGGEFHFLSNSKVDPYVLVGSGFGILMESSKRSTSYTYEVARSDGFLSYDSQRKNVAAPQFNINPFAGFGINYFFHPRMAIGAEYSLGPNMIAIQGTLKQSGTETRIFENGDVEIGDVDENIKINNFYLNVSQKVGLHFIYVLNRKK